MITVVESTTSEIKAYEESKYQEFLRYYFSTDLKVGEIFDLIGLGCSHNAVNKYIRKRLAAEGHNSLERVWSIKKGEWI